MSHNIRTCCSRIGSVVKSVLITALKNALNITHKDSDCDLPHDCGWGAVLGYFPWNMDADLPRWLFPVLFPRTGPCVRRSKSDHRVSVSRQLVSFPMCVFPVNNVWKLPIVIILTFFAEIGFLSHHVPVVFLYQVGAQRPFFIMTTAAWYCAALGATEMYSLRAQDGPQEMERNEATAKHVACPNCAWLLLSFFPLPVGHPEHGHCITLGNAHIFRCKCALLQFQVQGPQRTVITLNLRAPLR